jgi:hypothetical protein
MPEINTAPIKFIADSVRVSGPRQTDGSFLIAFELGEYMAGKAGEMLQIPRGKNLKVTIEIDD